MIAETEFEMNQVEMPTIDQYVKLLIDKSRGYQSEEVNLLLLLILITYKVN